MANEISKNNNNKTGKKVKGPCIQYDYKNIKFKVVGMM